jgi:hypothetical protein
MERGTTFTGRFDSGLASEVLKLQLNLEIALAVSQRRLSSPTGLPASRKCVETSDGVTNLFLQHFQKQRKRLCRVRQPLTLCCDLRVLAAGNVIETHEHTGEFQELDRGGIAGSTSTSHLYDFVTATM